MEIVEEVWGQSTNQYLYECSWSIHIFFWNLGFVELKEILWLSKDKRISTINVCDILLDVCVVIVQSLMHVLYLQVVHECTKLRLNNWVNEFLRARGLLEKK